MDLTGVFGTSISPALHEVVEPLCMEHLTAENDTFFVIVIKMHIIPKIYRFISEKRHF